MSAALRIFSYPVRIFIEDTDAGGIVYHSQYLNFMERGRTEYMRKLGFGKTAIHNYNAMMVVHSLDLVYRSPALLEDEIQVEVRPIELKRASITFKQNIYRGAELLVKGHVKIACIDKENHRPVAIPRPIYESLDAEMTALISGVDHRE